MINLAVSSHHAGQPKGKIIDLIDKIIALTTDYWSEWKSEFA
jgi:hypothetical protein